MELSIAFFIVLENKSFIYNKKRTVKVRMPRERSWLLAAARRLERSTCGLLLECRIGFREWGTEKIDGR